MDPAAPAFAVLRVPDFPLHAILRTRPQGHAGAFALIDGAHRKAVIIALSSRAKAAGVELGFTAPLAIARCPDLTVLVPDAGAEAEARAALVAVAFSLSPAVEDTGPGLCTIDLSGRSSDQREEALNEALRRLDGQGLPATAGLASSPLLALYAARETEAVRVVLSPRSFLDRLPLSAAEPPADLVPVLSGWGVRTLGDLTALPKVEVSRRLGPEGLALWERASGQATRPIHRTHPPQTFSSALDFEHEIETLEPLVFVLRRCLDRLASDLALAGCSATELNLQLTLSDETRHRRNLRLPEPTGNADLLFRTLFTHLEALQTASPVVGFNLELIPARTLVRQQGLFETGLKDPHGFAETLARTSAVVGSDRSGTPRCDNTHRPDSVILELPPSVVAPPLPEPALPSLGPPLRRFRPPRPATVEMTGEQPAFVWTATVQGTVTAISGPWAGSGDWWRPDLTWQRQEWDIALDDGGLYRMIHTPAGWFIEGEYD
ncbi:MAG: DNA polymerase Y family protein [Opitutaceae bacterium]|nr:DNA polymerase Y family protein [Opitutaceae bacterium]